MNRLKVAVASENGETLSGHAGTCRKYIIYHLENGEISHKELLELAPSEIFRKVFHDPEMKGYAHPLYEVDYVLVTAIGMNGTRKLKRRGVQALLVAEAENPDVVVRKLISGSLETYQPHEHSHGHGDHHHH